MEYCIQNLHDKNEIHESSDERSGCENEQFKSKIMDDILSLFTDPEHGINLSFDSVEVHCDILMDSKLFNEYMNTADLTAEEIKEMEIIKEMDNREKSILLYERKLETFANGTARVLAIGITKQYIYQAKAIKINCNGLSEGSRCYILKKFMKLQLLRKNNEDTIGERMRYARLFPGYNLGNFSFSLTFQHYDLHLKERWHKGSQSHITPTYGTVCKYDVIYGNIITSKPYRPTIKIQITGETESVLSKHQLIFGGSVKNSECRQHWSVFNKERFFSVEPFEGYEKEYDRFVPYLKSILESSTSGSVEIEPTLIYGKQKQNLGQISYLDRPKFRIRINVVTSSMFESAMTGVFVRSNVLEYITIHMDDCRMFLQFPVYKGGAMHRYDEKLNNNQ